jgi:hypothetical protein
MLDVYIVPEWHLLDDDAKNYLIEKALTKFSKWCTMDYEAGYYSARQQLVDHIVETDFIQVQATNVLSYWVDYMNTLKIDLSDNSKIRSLWYEVVYLLTDHHWEKGLHHLVRRIMIENYALQIG